MNIIAMAFRLSEVIGLFKQRARQFFYGVMLMRHACPQCGGSLEMGSEGVCRCRSGGHEFDPTLAFQRCTSCGGTPVLRARRYQCQKCGADIPPHFLFDGLVFNAEYFRAKMAEHRQQKKDRRDRVRQMLAECRSQPLDIPTTLDFDSVPGLLDALNMMTSEAVECFAQEKRETFDLKQYQDCVRAHLSETPVSLDDIPALIDDTRQDRIWRFIAIIFLAHAGVIDIWQDGSTIMVMKHETDREGQDVFGSAEDPDGVERPLGRVEA